MFDAASGGFLAPFLLPGSSLGLFVCQGVRSINASGHKFGLAHLGLADPMAKRLSDLP